ncbi:MAG: hypothetical protein AB7U75_09485 [Hyphomicrobiaceae bacterium]
MIRAMRLGTGVVYLTMTAAVLAFGPGSRAASAQGQSQLPSFVDERRLPEDAGSASKERQSEDTVKRLKDESDRLRERLSAETEARRKAEEEAARKAAEEEAARDKAEKEEHARQAAESARQAAERDAAREKAEQEERARQAEAARRAAEEKTARERAEQEERARQAAEAARKASEEEAARKRAEQEQRARQAAEAARKAAEEEAARKRAEQEQRARQAAEAARKAAEQAAARKKDEQEERARQTAEGRSRSAADDLARRMSSNGACRDMQLATEPKPAGRLEIKLRSPCLAGRPVTFVYAGHEFVRTVGDGGELTFVLDMFEGAAPVALKLDDGSTTNIDASSVNFAQVSKVAVLWSAPVNLDLHALEYLAPRDGPGHVWSKSPGSLDAALTAAREGSRGRGFLSTDDTGAGSGTHAEVYTFLHNKNQRQGAITLLIDYETRGDMPSGDYCGQGRLAVIEALVVRLRPGGKVEKETVRLGSAPCGQQLPESKRFNSDTLSDLLARG